MTIQVRSIVVSAITCFAMICLALPAQSQWLTGYEFRKQLTVDGADIPGNVTDFPLLINVTDADLQANALATGFDIVFTDDDGETPLNHELQSYNNGTGELLAWVQVTLTGATDKNIYMYFGNATIAADPSTTDTWDTNYEGVYHMEEANPTDATSSGFDLTAVNGATLATGNIGSAMDFDGNNDYLNFGTNIDLLRNTNSATISAWIRADNITTDQVIMGISRGNGAATQASRASIELLDDARIRIGGRADDADSFEAEREDVATISATGQWHYFTGVFDYANRNIDVYVDGVLSTSTLTSAPMEWTAGPTSDTPSRNSAIGSEDNGGSAYFNGLIDEVRISNTIRSADWIAITYTNLNDPETFIKEVADLEDFDGFLNGYTLRKRITIDNTDVYGSDDLTNFPFLVSLTDDDLRSTGNGGSVENINGYDMVFTSSTGVELINHQVESYDPTTGEYIAWVQIPRLKYNEDTDIYLYYGKTGATDPSTTDTWTSDYEAIFHMDDETTVVDAHDNTTVTNNGATEAVGQIGTALDFVPGESDYIDLDRTYHTTLSGSMTLSGWVNIDDIGRDNALLGQFDFPPESSYILWMDQGGSGVGFAFGLATNGSTIDKVGEDDAIANIQGNWKYVVGTWDGATMSLYVDGNLIDSRALGGTLDAQVLDAAIGTNNATNSPARLMDGQVDEVRISSEAKSADWIKTEYFNQLSPSNVYTVTDEALDQAIIAIYAGTKRIVIDSDKVFGSVNHTDFPVLISLTEEDLRTSANGGEVLNGSGYDIIFSDEGESNIFDHELEKYDASTGEYIAWVKVPELKTNEDTEIRIHFGRSGVSADPTTVDTWSSDYQGVWHLDESSTGGTDDYKDATTNGHDLTGWNGDASRTPAQAAGLISNAQSYDGARGIIATSYQGISGTSSRTLSGWFQWTTISAAVGIFATYGVASSTGEKFGMFTRGSLGYNVTAEMGGGANQVGNSTGLNDGNWHYIVLTLEDDGSPTVDELTIYIDGEDDGSSSSATDPINTGSGNFRIGINTNTGGRWEGLIDEVRLSNVAKSADWVKTEYHNQSDPSTFYTILDNSGDYAYQKQITIDSDLVFGSSPHEDFPYLISFTDDDLRSTGNGGNVESTDGFDIVFTGDDATTLLDHELESYDPATGAVVAWVKIPSLSPSIDTEINVFFGRVGATDPSTTSTWDSHFQAVWHLNETVTDEGTGAIHEDATANNNDGTQDGNDDIAGQVANGQDFDGANDHIDFSQPTLTTEVTLSAWVRHDAITGVRERYIDLGNDIVIRHDGNNGLGQLHFYLRDGAATNYPLRVNDVLTASTWHYVAGTYDGTTQRVFLDGQQVGSQILGITMGATAGTFGLSQNSETLDGRLDEARVSDVARSADWIKTEYYNMLDPSSGITITDVCVDPGTLVSSDTDLLTGESTTIYLTDYQSGTTLQWQSSTDGVTYADISDEISASFTTPALTQTTYYRVTVTSSGCIVNSDPIVISIEPNFLADYCYRKRITIDNTAVIGTGSHTDFPILIGLTDPDLRTAANDGLVSNANGFDIRFADNTGAVLDHELEYYLATSGELVAWVRIPSLSTSADTEIYMHFGNPLIVADQSVATTWSNDYKAVYHLNDNFNDATGVNDATEGAAGATNDVAGVIGRGRYFTGQANSWATASNDASIDTDITSEVTLQAWTKVFTPHPVDAAIIEKGTATNLERYMLGVQLNVDPGSVNARVTTGSGHFRYDDGGINGEWHQLSMTYNAGLGSDQLKVYMDGTLAYEENATGNISSSTGDLRLGVRNDGRQLTATLDEIRVLNVARSSEWLATEYNNQYSPGTFYSVGELSFSTSGGLAQADEQFVFVGGATSLSLVGHSGSIQWQQSTDNSSFTNIGGATSATLTTPVLNESTYFRAALSSGSCENFSNTVLVQVRSGFINDYSYRKQITIDPSNVPSSSNLSDFPLLVSLTDADLSTGADRVQSADGYDIIFTDLAGTQLDHDLELYEGATGTLVAWVRIPTLFANGETSLYMYYGNCGYAGGDQSSTGTWINYNGVWHLNDDDAGSTSDDRTANNNDGTLDAFNGDESVDAFIGKGFDFDGTNDRIFYGTGPLVTGAGTRTVEMWANIKNFDATNPGGAFTAGNSAANDFAWRMSTVDDQIILEYNNLNYTYQIEGAKDNWHHYALTYDGATVGVFVDGSLIDQIDVVLTTAANGTASNSVQVARWNSAEEQLTADEFRISNVARSEGWMATQYKNQSDPENFITLAAEEIEWVWKGTADTDWTNAVNWGGCNVPASGSDITISGTAPNFPLLTNDLSVGMLTIESGASIDVGTAQLSISGNIINEGTLTAGSGTLLLTGGDQQFLTGGGTYSLNNLTLNKSGGKVTIDDAITLQGTLNMTSGFLEIKDDQLTLASSATITSAGHDSFILTTGSSCLNQEGLDTGKGATVFPVGINQSSYSPATITNEGTSDDFCVRLLDMVFEDGASGTPISNQIVGRTWLIDEGTAGGSDVTLKLQWNSVEETSGFDRSQSYLSHYNSSNFWEVLSVADAAVSEGNNSFSRLATGVEDFSPFTLGSGSTPLPVELLFFKGEYLQDEVSLSWATAIEIDNDFFTIEKSQDGTSFAELATLPGQGDSDERVDYIFIDTKPLPGLNYYRLKQTDFDGTSTYSEVIVVADNRARTPALAVYPNANDGVDFYWSISGLTPNAPLEIAIYDLGGNLIEAQQVLVDTRGEYVGRGFANVTLRPGIYLLKATHQNEEMVSRIVVR